MMKGFYWDGTNKKTASIRWQEKGLVYRQSVLQRYNEVRIHQKNPANQQLPYITYLQNETLSVGDLVWVQVENNQVVHIGSVSIPKLRYKHGILDLLPEHLHPCSDYDALCPACRVFGWVHQQAPEDTNIPVAYAGRVHFLLPSCKENLNYTMAPSP